MRITGKALRDAERIIHLVMGAGLIVLAFTPLGQGELGGPLRLVIAPFVVGSGLMMWQHARVTRALRSSDRLPIRIA